MRNGRLFFLIALMCLMFPGYGQTTRQDSVKTDSLSADTVKNKFLPTGIRVGYDLLGAGRSYFQDHYNGWEVTGDVDFDRYLLTVEYGKWGRNLGSDSATYANTGRYWRVGIDVNFLTTDPDRNVFFLGARYGKSIFTENMSVMRYDRVWKLMSDNFSQVDVNASWIELTTGLKVKIWKTVWLGYTARFKFGLSAKGSPEMLPYDVPGFGLTNKETTWGFNYYLLFRLPVRKAPPVPPKKK